MKRLFTLSVTAALAAAIDLQMQVEADSLLQTTSQLSHPKWTMSKKEKKSKGQKKSKKQKSWSSPSVVSRPAPASHYHSKPTTFKMTAQQPMDMMMMDMAIPQAPIADPGLGWIKNPNPFYQHPAHPNVFKPVQPPMDPGLGSIIDPIHNSIDSAVPTFNDYHSHVPMDHHHHTHVEEDSFCDITDSIEECHDCTDGDHCSICNEDDCDSDDEERPSPWDWDSHFGKHDRRKKCKSPRKRSKSHKKDYPQWVHTHVDPETGACYTYCPTCGHSSELENHACCCDQKCCDDHSDPTPPAPVDKCDDPTFVPSVREASSTSFKVVDNTAFAEFTFTETECSNSLMITGASSNATLAPGTYGMRLLDSITMGCNNIGDIYNPTHVHDGGELTDLEVNWSNQFNYVHTETNNSLFGDDSLGGRTLLIYKKATYMAQAAPIACGSIIYKKMGIDD